MELTLELKVVASTAAAAAVDDDFVVVVSLASACFSPIRSAALACALHSVSLFRSLALALPSCYCDVERLS